MTKRRDKGDGSIYQRASDKKWVAYVKMENGKKKYVYGNTKTEASKKLKELQRTIDAGTCITARAETVEAYMRYWLDIHKVKLKPATHFAYGNYLTTALKHIGHIKLQKLTGEHLQKMYTELQKTHKPSSIYTLHGIIKTAMKAAIRWKRIARNPCDEIDAPINSRDERPVLNAEQSRALLAVAQGTDLECFLAMALTTGMRRGEMLGLRWADIDMIGKVLKVQRTASYTKLPGEKYGFIETSPKTKSSRREILLTDFLISMLKTHKKKQVEMRLQARQRWADKDLVFCNALGEHLPVKRLTTHYRILLQQCNLPQIHIHDLRHSASTLLLSMGVPMKVVQEILGHSSIVITMNIYGHIADGMQENATEKMNNLFKKDGTN
jgi:integrase